MIVFLALLIACTDALTTSIGTSTINVTFEYNATSVQIASIASADNSIQFASNSISLLAPLWTATIIKGNAPTQQRLALSAADASRWTSDVGAKRGVGVEFYICRCVVL
jgi:hypothetical protein